MIVCFPTQQMASQHAGGGIGNRAQMIRRALLGLRGAAGKDGGGGTGGGGARWRQSAHSIGYEDEYELASAPLSVYSSGLSLGWESSNANGHNGRRNELPSFGENSRFAAIDADEEAAGTAPVDAAVMPPMPTVDGRERMLLELSRFGTVKGRGMALEIVKTGEMKFSSLDFFWSQVNNPVTRKLSGFGSD